MIELYNGNDLSLSNVDENRQIFEKYSVKFNENPSSGSRVIPCGRTDGQTDMKKLIVALRNFTNAPARVKAQQLLSTLEGHVGPLYGDSV